MFNRTKKAVRRLRVRLAPLVVVLTIAFSMLLDQLQVIDLKPILSHVVREDRVDLYATCIGLLLAFMKPMIHLAPHEDE